MRQQELLLLVLGIVIIVLGTVVGIQAYEKNQDQANVDALVQDATNIAYDAQVWKLKQIAFDNSISVTDWSGISFEALGYSPIGNWSSYYISNDGKYRNLNGIYDMNTSGTILVITAKSYRENGEDWNTVSIWVRGIAHKDIDVDCRFRNGPKLDC